ncbi:MAG: nuclear transport factor 2 family protein [Armatimonadetes bacterium]|nr:nuclear transport factor 2 family protein [Armatimonadota bacterium]
MCGTNLTDKCKAEVDLHLGEKLIRDLWAAIKAQNWSDVESKIASGFQSVHQDGSRNCQQEIELIKELNLGEYELFDFKVSRMDSTLIISYMVSVKERIDGIVLSEKTATRLSIMQELDNKWFWIAHANLIPLK